MKNPFGNSALWYTFFLFILGFVAFFTHEIVTFIMLGFVIIVLTNICNQLHRITTMLERERKETHTTVESPAPYEGKKSQG